MGSGRLPDEGVKRDVVLHVRVTADDAISLDEQRGAATRSHYLRQLIRGVDTSRGKR